MDSNEKLKRWQEFEPFVRYKISAALHPEQRDYFDDVLQECYIQFEEAIKTYDESQGKSFAGWFMSYYFNRAIVMAIYGGRTERYKLDPCNYSDSLERPLDEEEGITLQDTIIDTEAETYYRRVEDNDFWHYVGNLIIKGAESGGESKLPGEIIRTMIYYDLPLGKAIEKMGGLEEKKKYYNAYTKGIRWARLYIMKHIVINKGKTCIEEEIPYYGTGLSSFRNKNFTSSVEYFAIKHITEEEMLKDLEEIIY